MKLTVIGEENVPTDVPVLYIGNHRSFFDVPITYPRCPIRTGYIAKKEMEKVPLLSTWMKRLHCLFLDRNDLKQGLKTILTAIEKVKSGISICIFPEGTRNKNEDELDMLPFHEGSFKIAAKTNCPIIPMAISGSADIWENHFPRVQKTHVILEYGKPIYIDQLEKEDKKHLGAYTQNIIHEMLVKNKVAVIMRMRASASNWQDRPLHKEFKAVLLVIFRRSGKIIPAFFFPAVFSLLPSAIPHKLP